MISLQDTVALYCFHSFPSFNGAHAAYHSPPRSHADHEGRHQSTSPLPVPLRSRKNSNPYDQVCE